VLRDEGWSDRQRARHLERKQKQAASNATTLPARAIRGAVDDGRARSQSSSDRRDTFNQIHDRFVHKHPIIFT
jgi:hypothetical protein